MWEVPQPGVFLSNPTAPADGEQTPLKVDATRRLELSETGGAFKTLLDRIGTVVGRTVMGFLEALVWEARAAYGSLRPDQLYIERWGAASISGTQDQLLSNASVVPNANYTNQALDYTVPESKKFLLKGFRIALDGVSSTVTIAVSIQVGPDKKIRYSLNTNSPTEGGSFDPPIPVPAGTPILIHAHSSSQAASTIVFARFTGIEEPA